MTDTATFIEPFLAQLSVRSVRYGQDYNPRSIPSLRIKRRPEPITTSFSSDAEEEEEEEAKFQVVIKIVKPAFQFTIAHLSPHDTIATLKARIYQQHTPYAVSRQRLLLKGKSLSDSKQLSDYAVEEGTTLHLMLSPPKPLADSGPVLGRWGVSLSTEKALDSSTFWIAIEQAVQAHVDAQDSLLVMDRLRRALE
ncbi:hypothetical protein BDF14DRAFT_1780555 [Spinellus fusiger]|nr:hypothetical protein BDF14DRAFT_1780555 [Spinellus fusiger]